MFFHWTLDKKDFSFIKKVSRTAYFTYLLYNILGNILAVSVLLIILFITAIMFWGEVYLKASPLIFISCFLIYLIFLFNKSSKNKKSCRYITKSNINDCTEYTLSFENDDIVFNNISYTHNEVAAVFLLNEYAVFTLKDKAYFIVKPGEHEIEFYNWLKSTNLLIYAWCNTFTAKAASRKTRKQYLKKIKPVIFLTSAFFIIFCIIPTQNKNIPNNIVSENVQPFTFDMNKNIYNQLNELYEYYEATHNFEATTDIYYSYVNQTANFLSKTNYKDGDATEDKELLFIDNNDFYYIKLCKLEDSDYSTIKIINKSETIIIQENKNGYNVTKHSAEHNYTAKDMYRLLTEYDYICNEYPLYKSAWYQYGSANIKFKTDRLFGDDIITYRMSEHDITVYNTSKDVKFEVTLNNILINDIENLTGILSSVYSETSNSSLTFIQLTNEINRIL